MKKKMAYIKGGYKRIGDDIMYMELKDLTKGQLAELKIKYLDELLMKKENRNISYGEMAFIDDIIADDDEDFINEFSGYSFVNDDFFTDDRNKNFE